ncbi:MAG: beta-hydroxyacyl-ACP dehydratase [Phycisphaera sp.]|nr:MAG: beta-hydroxyacyl-ACP dehydratase [Phycisphaera sp.]
MRWMWIDRVIELEPRKRMVAIKNITLAEEHLHDHFPATDSEPALPVMPASLMIEGMAQTAGVLVGHAEGFKEKVILAKVSDATIDEDAGPGMTIRYSAEITQIDEQGAATKGTIELLDHANADAGYRQIGSVNLMFSHIDNNRSGIEFPEHNFVFGDGFKTLLRTSGIEVEA